MENKFQTNFDIVRLYDEKDVPPPVTKVGVLPFMDIDSSLKFMLMKPRSEARHIGPPAFQLAKGTRRINVNGNWCDMREDDLRHADESFYEPLLATALREGREEIGLRESNIAQIYDMGGFTFTSATRGFVKPIHMFAARLRSERDFDPFEETTGEAKWMTPAEFEAVGRSDHVRILQAIAGKLREAI